MSIVTKARKFATMKHKGQLRKYTREPYIVHPAEVVEILDGVTKDQVLLAAAWLHDTLEDTATTCDELIQEFGYEVATLVVEVTDIIDKTMKRKERKAIRARELGEASKKAQTLKLADLISNTKSIMSYDPDFARVYLREAQVLIQVLTKGNAHLRRRLARILEEE